MLPHPDAMAGRHRTSDIHRFIRLACTPQHPEGQPPARLGIHPRLSLAVGIMMIISAAVISAWLLIHDPTLTDTAPSTPQQATHPPRQQTNPEAQATVPQVSPPTNATPSSPQPGPVPSGEHGPDASTVTIDLAGAVVNPGVYHLPAQSRLDDAIQQAGGVTPDALMDFVNRARTLTDGEHIRIPFSTDPPELQHLDMSPPMNGRAHDGAEQQGSTVIHGAVTSASDRAAVNINDASAQELTALPGIGPALAQAIITYRTEHGPLGSVDELLGVPGIGPAKLSQLRDYATV